MRLFLSYGHDEHTPFALRLKSDLAQQGHDVWFDVDRLKPSADWENYIEEGIERVAAERGRFLLLLTPHSVRRPNGYCLNELARACSRQLPIIPLMVSTVDPPLSICRIQWIDFRDSIPAEQHEVRYASHFQKLLDTIEHDVLNFEGAQAKLHSVLRPIEYDEASRHLRRFTGREWIMTEVERWLASGRRVLWITGEAGIGKSALAAWLCDRRPEIIGAHYFRYNNANRSARRGLLSIAWQLSTQLQDYERRLSTFDLDAIGAETDIRGLFERLFVEPFTHHFPMPKRGIVLLIDALDEAAEKGANDMASLIGTEWSRTPEWMRLIVTSRPYEAEINSALQALDPWVFDAGREENREDIRNYLRRELRQFTGNGQPQETIVDAIQEKSEGVFLYACLVREQLEERRLSLGNVEAFPRGLAGIYSFEFKRYFPDLSEYVARWRPVIETICAARQPLPLADLGVLFPAFYSPNEIAGGLGSLFPDLGGGVRPFHQSLRDWVTRPDKAGVYAVRVDLGHRRLADEGWRQYENSSEEWMSTYLILHLAEHLSSCQLRHQITRLLLDFRWVCAKLARSDVGALLVDYEYGKEDQGCMLVRDAIRLSAYVISKYPDQLAPQLVGRLLPYCETPGIRQFVDDTAVVAHGPWLRPLKPALCPPGTGLVCTLEGHAGPVYHVAVTPDGKWAISASQDKTLKVWDLSTGRVLRTLEGHSDEVRGVAMAPDGKWAISASRDKTLKVWDLETGVALRTLKGHTFCVYGVAVTPDGKLVVSGSEDTKLKVWDLEAGYLLRTLEDHRRAVYGVAVTPDGKRAVSASSDGTLKVWDLETGGVLLTLTGHYEGVADVSVTSNGSRAVSAGDKTLRVWNLETGRELHKLKGHTQWVHGVAVTPDGRLAVSASHDHTLKVWDLESGVALRTLEGHSDWVYDVEVTPDGKRAVSASHDHTLKMWDLAAQRSLEGHAGRVYHVAVTPDGKWAISASQDKTLKVWDLSTGRVLRTLEGHSDEVRGVAMAPDGKWAISASQDKTLKVWDLETGCALRTLADHSKWVTGVAVTPDGKRAVSASHDKTLKVWDLETGQVLHTLKGHSFEVWDVAVTLDGRRAVSASYDGTLKVWDLESGRALRTLLGRLSRFHHVTVTPDGQRAVSLSTSSQNCTLWDLESGCALRTLADHSKSLNGVAVTPDGRLAVSSSYDNTLKVWDLETGLLVAKFHCDAAPLCCAFADRQRVLAGDVSGRLHFLLLEDPLAAVTAKL